MNLTTRQIKYVSEVGRLGSIHAASETLHISQSSIVAAVNQAEELLNAKIFERRPARGVQVTPAGERFLVAARAFLAAATDFERNVGTFASATPQVVRLGCFEPFGSLFIAEVLRAYVDLSGPVEIVLIEGDQQSLRRWLQDGAVDMIVTYEIGPSFDEYAVTRICKAPTHVVLPVHHDLSRLEVLSIRDLSNHPMVLLDLPQTSTYLMTLLDLLAERPVVAIRTRSFETCRAAVSAGFGFSFANIRPTGRSSKDGPGIVRRPLKDAGQPPALIVVDIYGAAKPAFVRRFVDVLKNHFQKVGAENFAVATEVQMSTIFDV